MQTPKKRPGRPKGKDAAYRKIATRLYERLQKGEWSEGEPLPTYRQLAEEYNVGMQVVRLAMQTLRKDGKVSLNPRQQAVAKGVSNTHSGVSNLTALVLGYNLSVQASGGAFFDMQCGIQRALGEALHPLLIVHDPSRLRKTVPPDMMDLPLRGIMLMGNFQKKVLKEYSRMNVPMVLIDRPSNQPSFSSVSVHNEKATYEATKRLIALGHRHIAFMRFVQLNLRDIDEDSKERELGYRRALEESGLSVPSGGVLNSFNRDHPNSPSVQALFSADPPFTAVVTVDEGRAHIAEEGARKRGLSVPHDFSIVTFSAVGSACRFSGPQTDFEALGHQAARLILASPETPQHVKVPTVWHEGQTMARPQ